MSQRVIEIDVAKGLCILLMVIGHSGMIGALHNMIYAFHIPFFFFISGVTSNVERPFGDYSISKIRGLMIPFCFYYLIHIPCYAFVYNKGLIDYFKSELIDRIDGALWFVPILFFAQIINWMIPRVRFVEVLAVILLASISSILCIEEIFLPWNFSTLGFAASFVILGRIMSLGGARMFFASELSMHRLLIGFISCLVLLFMISNHYKLMMYFDRIEPILPIMVGALVGIGCVLLISLLIKRKNKLLSRFLAYTGVNTFVFIGFSQFILKFENLYIREYVVLKYVILFLSLYAIIYVKNRIYFARVLRL